MTALLDLPAALTAAGVNVRLLDGWDSPKLSGYLWREPDGEPAGAMWHHTAGSAYTPNRDKANAWAGMTYDGTDRLYQSGGGDGAYPVIVIANAYPAPISSGYGVRQVLESFVKRDLPFHGKQTLPDDDPKWAGNTHYWNCEVVLDGTGTAMEEEVWQMLATTGRVLGDLYGWTTARHIGHAQHTRRKIDLRDGRFGDAATTIEALRLLIGEPMSECPWTQDEYPPCESHYFPPSDLMNGNGAGEMQGQCNVPDNQHAAVQWAFDTGRFKAGNRYRYDYAAILTEGREMVFEYRDSR